MIINVMIVHEIKKICLSPNQRAKRKESDNMSYIITKGNENYILQRVNKLKGNAMEKIIKETKQFSTIEKSILNIFKSLNIDTIKYLSVNKKFTVNKKKFTKKNIVLEKDEFSVLELPYIVSFKKLLIVNNKRKFVVKSFKAFSVNELIDCLRAVKVISIPSYKTLNKRIDFFGYWDGIAYVYESKNKEATGLSVGDFLRTLLYPIILVKFGVKVKKVSIIYNGELRKRTINIKDKMEENFPFKIRFMKIKEYLRWTNENIGFKYCGMTIEKKTKEQIKNSKDSSKYNYLLMKGELPKDKFIISLNLDELHKGRWENGEFKE